MRGQVREVLVFFVWENGSRCDVTPRLFFLPFNIFLLKNNKFSGKF